VGTGFHPELTGRENVYLNGSVLGMNRRYVRSRFDEIIEFAGVEQALDRPLKHYSSGMALRLAFAVAAVLPSEVLLVDEVLAVGDAEFQRRCVEYLRSAEMTGRTVVFVSHDLEAVSRLCARAIWLDRGRVEASGLTGDVVGAYLRSVVTQPDRAEFDLGEGALRVSSVTVVDQYGHRVSSVIHGQAFQIEVRYTIVQPLPGFDLAIFIDRDGITRVLDEMMSDQCTVRPSDPGSYVARMDIPPVLNVGEYHVGIWMGVRLGTGSEELGDLPAIARFRVEGNVRGRPGRLVELNLPWTVIEDAGGK
jgi:ABC-2 type transport system ATP-binding protein/lipopolysaccharide transport system ATP-binding protein